MKFALLDIVFFLQNLRRKLFIIVTKIGNDDIKAYMSRYELY